MNSLSIYERSDPIKELEHRIKQEPLEIVETEKSIKFTCSAKNLDKKDIFGLSGNIQKNHKKIPQQLYERD